MVPPSPSPTNTTLFIVDGDTPALREGLSTLANCGYQLCWLGEGAELLREVHAAAPDLILLATQLPDGQSWELCQQLKLSVSLSQVPVIFLGTQEAAAPFETVLAAGGVDYIQFPIHPLGLEARIQPHLRIRQLQRQLDEQTTVALHQQNQGLELGVHQRTAALQESERRLSKLIRHLPGYVYRVANDPNCAPEFISEGVTAITGYHPNEYLVDRTISCGQEIHPDDAEAVWEIVQRGVAERQLYECEYRIRTKSGKQKWVWERGQGVYSEATGELLFLEGFVTDISDRKQTEAAQQQSEALYRRLAEDMPTLICQFLPDSTLTYVNPAYCQSFDKCFDELVGSKFLDLLPNDLERQTVQANYLSLTPEAPTAIYEHAVVRPDGSEGWQRWIDRAFFDDQGSLLHFQSIGFDITDRKQTEIALRHSEARFQALAANIPGVIYRHVLRQNGSQALTYISPRGQELFELDAPLAEQDLDRFWSMVHPDDLESLQNAMVQTAQTMEPSFLEYRILTPSGVLKWIQGSVRPERQPNGDVIWNGVLIDISERVRLETERQQAEADLQAQRERLQIAMEAASMGVWEGDFRSNQERWSPQVETLFGFEPGTFDGDRTHFLERVHPDDRALVNAGWAEAMQTGLLRHDFRVVLPDQTIRWISTLGKVFYDSVGNPFQVIGVDVDITERKQVEIALARREAQFRSLIDNLPFEVWAKDRQGRVIVQNPLERLRWGDDLNKVTDTSKLSPEIRTAWEEQDHRVWNGEVVQVEESMCINGQWRIYAKILAPIWNSNQIEGMVGVNIDITERKRTEEALAVNERRLRTIIEAEPECVKLVAADGTILDMNPAGLMMLEADSPDQVIGQTAISCIAPEYRNAFVELGQRIFQGETGQLEFVITGLKGTQRWVDSHAVPLRNEQNEIVGILAITRDISDRKRSELEILQLNRALEQQNRNLEALIEQRTAELVTFINALPDYIFVVERREMRILFCNERLASTTLLSDRQIVQGKTIFECFPPEHAAYFADQNRQVFESGETLHTQESFELVSGQLHLDTYKIPLKRPDGEVYALIGTSRDITELVLARQTLMQRTAQLEASNKELESFSYSVSHDLRAPLRHVHGFVNALQQRLQSHGALSDAKVVHYLQVIESSSQKMSLLIDGLLTLSRVGRKPITYATVPLRSLVEEAIALVQNSPEISVPVEIIIGDLPTVQADSTLLQQVFVNLMGNAVKFSRNSTAPRIEVGSLPEGTIFVRDNGVGFPMEYADKLFGAFQRLHSQSEFEGTGIGLAIVQRIIHRHGGSIWAESQPNHGATFYFNLRGLQ